MIVVFVKCSLSEIVSTSCFTKSLLYVYVIVRVTVRRLSVFSRLKALTVSDISEIPVLIGLELHTPGLSNNVIIILTERTDLILNVSIKGAIMGAPVSRFLCRIRMIVFDLC